MLLLQQSASSSSSAAFSFSSRFPLRQAERALQLNGSLVGAAGLRLIPPPPDYANYMNKQCQQLIAANTNNFLINGRLKATSEHQLNQGSIAHANDRLSKPTLDLASLRQQSQNLDLPLITAL